jgi:hypothetical protein
VTVATNYRQRGDLRVIAIRAVKDRVTYDAAASFRVQLLRWSRLPSMKSEGKRPGFRAAEADGGFAVVDVDTSWRDDQGRDFHWHGRACKVYTCTRDGAWKLIMHTGLLAY